MSQKLCAIHTNGYNEAGPSKLYSTALSLSSGLSLLTSMETWLQVYYS